jgi:hypothetical protein
LKSFFTVNDIAYQLVPPHCHRRNAAERAIRTFKEHFVAGLSSVDPSFPMHLWDRLLPQAEITLNLLRTSRLHPQLSAATHYHGLVDYNKTAFAPPGYKIIAHEKPEKRRTWAPHGQHGYSLGPAMHHYRCQNVYISTTASERIVDTLEFFPHNYQPRHRSPPFGSKHIRSHSNLISEDTMPVDCAQRSNHCYFHYAPELSTLILAHMFDSLVCVSRRGKENYFVSVTSSL